MLETLLTSGGSSLVEYPDSGPGSKLLKFGTEQMGYFGEVTPAELFTISELRSEFNFYAGTDLAQSAWMKIFVFGKILFVPVNPLINSLTWNNVYDAGLVYGTNDDGVFPGSTPINQLKLISKGNDTFKIRLFKGGVDDPTAITGRTRLSSSAPELIGSEYGAAYVALTDFIASGYTGPKFQIYSPSIWRDVITQTTRLSAKTNFIVYDVGSATPTAKSNAYCGWLPVLELTPFSETPLRPVDQIANAASFPGGYAIPKDFETTPDLLPIVRMQSTSNVVDALVPAIEIVGEFPMQVPSLSVRFSVDSSAPIVPKAFAYE